MQSESSDGVPRETFEGGSLTLHDCWTATDVGGGGTQLVARKTAKCTNYSKQVFDATDYFVVALKVYRRNGARVHLGVVDDSARGCQNFAVGEKEVPNSLGCVITDDEVWLVRDDKVFFRGNCDTRDPTVIRMYFVKGHVAFKIDDGVVNSDELRRLNFNGDFRLGVSLMREGQAVEIVSVQPCDELPGGGGGGGGGGGVEGLFKKLLGASESSSKSSVEQRPFNGSAFKMRDSYRSTNIEAGGRRVVCVKDFNSTNYSHEVFGSEASFTVVLTLPQVLSQRRVHLGLVPVGSEDSASNYTCGEKEIAGSIGLAVDDGKLKLVDADVVKGSMDIDMKGEMHVMLTYDHGKLAYRVDGFNLPFEALKTRTFTGRYRLGVSVTAQGQAAELTYVGPAHDKTALALGAVPTARTAHSPYQARARPPGKPFTWHRSATQTMAALSQYAPAAVSGDVATAAPSGDSIAVVYEPLSPFAFLRYICNQCGAGRDPKGPFVGDVYHCLGCDDFDFCPRCHAARAAGHMHSEFACLPGGPGFLEVPIAVEFCGQPVTVIVGPASELAMRGTQSGFESAVVQPSGDSVIRVRVYTGHVLVMRGATEVLLSVREPNTKLNKGTQRRVAIRFQAAGQRARLQPPVEQPAEGAAVALCVSDSELRGACNVHGSAGYRPEMQGCRGTVSKVDDDGTVLVNGLWYPTWVFTASGTTNGPAGQSHSDPDKAHSNGGTPGGNGGTPGGPGGQASPHYTNPYPGYDGGNSNGGTHGGSHGGSHGGTHGATHGGTEGGVSRQSHAHLLQPDMLAPIQLKATFAAPTGEEYLRALRDLKSVLSKVGDTMDHIVGQAVQLARARLQTLPPSSPRLSEDQAITIALYTFDLGTMGDEPDGSDNFYYQLNEALRERDPPVMQRLKPFLYHFKKAMDALPGVAGVKTYRGVPAAGRPLVEQRYRQGVPVYWTAMSSVSSDRSVAEKFAGPGGVVFEVTVTDARDIARYSSIPKESELVLLPNAQFVVSGRRAGARLECQLQQVQSEGVFVF